MQMQSIIEMLPGISQPSGFLKDNKIHSVLSEATGCCQTGRSRPNNYAVMMIHFSVGKILKISQIFSNTVNWYSGLIPKEKYPDG